MLGNKFLRFCRWEVKQKYFVKLLQQILQTVTLIKIKQVGIRQQF